MYNKWVVKNEFAEMRIKTWDDLIHCLETNFLDWSEFIYRGQSDSDWLLRSKFDRDYEEIISGIEEYNSSEVSKIKGKIRLEERSSILNQHLLKFKKNTVGRRGVSPKELTELEWFGLGQHFGLSTPLLDWSTSPYVSLYFSLINKYKSKSGFHALWVFSPVSFQDIHINQNHNVDLENQSIKLINNALCEENQRVVSQSGVFTLTPNGEDIESYITNNISLAGFAPVLYKIMIPNECRDDFLRHLEAMNIHSGTLFPDLIGAADFANRDLEKVKTLLLRRKTDSFEERLLSVNLCH
ncbi:FRG domain-containing protein [Aliivibrio fischeri]|uniref:FRG domain-containing protein n=1 Tax=Aliivibrio fischeri TaxID=668 RepID=UPI0012D85BE3|nr:FRG domain-containing protein [Aliivibrio fischeri]MUI54404.1 FRG domain-containing protein [Aliivibrio fischeri]